MANEAIKSKLTVRQFSTDLAKYEGLISRLVPKYFPPERMVQLAISCFMRTPALQQCTFLSIVNSVAIAAQLGLEFNSPLQHSYLIPYGKICTLQPGYRGLLHLALQSPRVHNVSAHVVRANDAFSFTYGTHGELTHEWGIADNRGDWLGAYCLVRYKDGDPSYLVMSKQEIEDIRDRSSQAWRNGKQDSPWFTYPDEMRRKTVTRRHLKFEELSPLCSRAVGYDEQAESGKMQTPIVEIEDYSVLDEQMNPEAQVDPKVEQARKEAGKPAEPGGEGLKQRLKATAKDKIPIFGTKDAPVEWPDVFDGPALVWNGERYEFDGEGGNYRKVEAACPTK